MKQITCGIPVTPWWRPARGGPGAPVPAALEVAHTDSALPFWGLLAFSFILLVAPQNFIPALAPLRIALLSIALTVAAYLFDRFKQRRPFIEFTRETVIVTCLLLWAVMTVPLSYWPGGSITFLTDIYLKTLIVFWLISHIVNTLPRLRLIVWALSLMSVPLAIVGVTNLLSGNFISTGVPEGSTRIIGYDAPLTQNPNDLALMLNMILPLSIALFLASRKPGVRAVLLGCICLNAVGVIATFSRGGFLTLTVIFVTYVWILLMREQRHWAYFAIFLALASLPLLPSSYVDRLTTIIEISSDPSGSAQARWGDTLAALHYVAYHPVIGAGVGMDVLALNEVRGPTWTVIHNVYLQYAVDLGIPGLILFLILLAGSLRNTRIAQHRSGQWGARAGDLFYIAEGIRVSLIAFAVAAMFHPVGYHFNFYYMAGLALAARMISAPNPADHGGARLSPTARQL
jgi:hypothetical protein